MSVDSVLATIYLAAGLLVALVVHEYAHAWTALRLGDVTSKLAGRLTLDPRPHSDPFGTLILPGILLLVVLLGGSGFGASPLVFAYAKPQTLNPWSLRRPDRDPVLIALAGPAANLLLALAFGLLLRLGLHGELGRLVVASLLVNVILAAMNLMPIPPLDGSRVIARFLPPRARDVFVGLEQYGALFMLLIFFILPGPIFAFVRAIGNGICQGAAGGSCL